MAKFYAICAIGKSGQKAEFVHFLATFGAWPSLTKAVAAILPLNYRSVAAGLTLCHFQPSVMSHCRRHVSGGCYRFLLVQAAGIVGLTVAIICLLD